jgi:hypothetical protein
MSLKICCQATATLSMVTAYTVYIVYGIDYLVKYYHLDTECPNSYLWVYILMSLIVSSTRTNMVKIREMETQVFTSYLLCLFLTDGCFAIWGSSELFNKRCKPIVSSDLWLYGYVTFIIQVTMLSIYSLLCTCSIALACYDNYKFKEYNSINTV